MPAHDYASTRFSELAEIDTGNVKNLTVSIHLLYGCGPRPGGAPLVVNGRMYIVAPYPNELFALDLTKPGAPLEWSYKPEPLAAAQGVACCDVVNRGAFYYDGAVYYATLDGRAVAVDAKSGKELWKTTLGDINKGETITMAPEVVKGKVLIGNSGGEYGVRGWLAALDAKTGVVQWKAFSTGPDSEVLIGSDFRPFYQSGQRPRSRHAERGRRGPGRLAAYGMGMDILRSRSKPDLLRNRQPRPLEPRPTTREITNGRVASLPAIPTRAKLAGFTRRCHTIFTDYDSINELILLDLDLSGRKRKVLLRPERKRLHLCYRPGNGGGFVRRRLRKRQLQSRCGSENRRAPIQR